MTFVKLKYRIAARYILQLVILLLQFAFNDIVLKRVFAYVLCASAFMVSFYSLVDILVVLVELL